MKNIIGRYSAKILLFSFVSIQIVAQEERKSVLKLNLSAVALGAATVQYEKAVGRHISLALGVGYRPQQLIPFAKNVEKYIDFADNKIDYVSFENVRKTESKLGLFHVTPELRFYFGKQAAPIGFYVSVFAKYNAYQGKVPVFVDIDYRNVPVRLELPVDTQLKTASVGLMIGKQFRLGNRFTFDWYIAGGHIGRAKVDGQSKQNLEGFDEDFRNRLRNKILTTFKINEEYLGLTVDNQGVIINNVRHLKYANLRGFGFNLGYRF